MQGLLVVQLLALVFVANGTPIVAKKILGKALASPLDGGALFIDGRPLLGASKTLRGVILSILATSASAPLIGLEWRVGALVAAAAMTGDLLSSFVKRRMGVAASSRAIGLDQIPESLLPLVACGLLLPLTILDIAVATVIFFVVELALSRIFFKLHIRDRPF
jgi:CDP-diglyceride synthetase